MAEVAVAVVAVVQEAAVAATQAARDTNRPTAAAAVVERMVAVVRPWPVPLRPGPLRPVPPGQGQPGQGPLGEQWSNEARRFATVGAPSSSPRPPCIRKPSNIRNPQKQVRCPPIPRRLRNPGSTHCRSRRRPCRGASNHRAWRPVRGRGGYWCKRRTVGPCDRPARGEPTQTNSRCLSETGWSAVRACL